MDIRNFIKIYEKSFAENWDLPALTEYGKNTTLTYADFAEMIAKTHLLFESIGLKEGDKIALCGKDSSNWVQVFMATVTYGAVIVPILAEFNPADAVNIINHSDAVLLFASDSVWQNIDSTKLEKVKGVVSLEKKEILYESPGNELSRSLRLLNRRFNSRFPDGFSPEDIKYADRENSEVVEINYTSGTTGFSKGVMLTGENLSGNVCFALSEKLHFRGSRTLSFLPLAHAYGCAFDLLTPLAAGSHVYLLGKIPSPRVLLKALDEVRPSLVISVPLVLEKIYRNQIVPMLSKGVLKTALSIPFLRPLIYSKIRKKLIGAFGGVFKEVIVGGAALNHEVEEFFKKIKFPFTVGYGMTECGPLISYSPWKQFVIGSSGRTIPVMESKILSTDPVNVPGEICVKGVNRMKGYYKNPEATAQVIDDDGWLHTGDMGTRNPDGTLFLRGRYKTMILSASGQNIYPEEIEAKLNNMPYVAESLVVDRDGKLVALVYPDAEAIEKEGIKPESLEELMESMRKDLNKMVAPYEQIAKVSVMPQEFEKTPKRSIKRFLYS
ncbi:MAG: AMP-binding protein [Muribaculaceae bacterium]|nr:AMP-binding protein [Muribaculaceae bacterium]